MTSANSKYDIAIVGAGIVGLSLAYEAARQGLRVVLFERQARPQGATIRNFGMVWPIGQPPRTIERALRSREVWLELAQKAGFWAQPWGSLHLAYHEDELHVLEEFKQTTRHYPYQVEILTPEDTLSRSRAVNPIGLEGALFSATEVNIDPREAANALHRYLREALEVTIEYNTAITQVSSPRLYDGRKEWSAERIFICTGSDFETLYPEIFDQSGMIKCKLQMMRTVPQPKNWELGPNLAAGLTLQHYRSFAHCESLALLKRRIAREMADYNRWGIHVMMSQTRQGELTIGDSHEYGSDPSPFDKSSVNELILRYLRKFVNVPSLEIAETWNGVYAKLPDQTEFITQPEPGVTIVNGLGGAGMTLSFGLAQEVLAERHSVPRRAMPG